jgi:serine/threonine protein kinase
VDILKQIVNGFLSLVREGIIHRYFSPICRDMKPANVLISGGEMKIADFGFAKKNVTRKMKN